MFLSVGSLSVMINSSLLEYRFISSGVGGLFIGLYFIISSFTIGENFPLGEGNRVILNCI